MTIKKHVIAKSVVTGEVNTLCYTKWYLAFIDKPVHKFLNSILNDSGCKSVLLI